VVVNLRIPSLLRKKRAKVGEGNEVVITLARTKAGNDMQMIVGIDAVDFELV